MTTDSKIAQPTWPVAPSPRHLALFFAVILATLWGAFMPREAAADDDLWVLGAGGVDRLQGLTVRTPTGGEPRLEQASDQRLTLSDGGLATYSDLVVLPDGDFLLADGSGRGGVLFDPQGQQRQAYFPAGDIEAPSSLVALGFAEPDTPDLVLMGDDSVGRVLVYDIVDSTYRWHNTFSRDGQLAEFARAIALPDDRFAVALQWPALGLSALQIVTWEATSATELTLWSADPNNGDDSAGNNSDGDNSDDPIIIDGIHPIRDLSADLTGQMLITSRDQLTLVDASGQVQWTFRRGDAPAVGGEFQSARRLPSGLIVAATRQPGRWTSPHTNHRVHLLDPERTLDEALLSQSDNFEAAPRRLELAAGTAPTGTVDYYANAYDLGDGSLQDLSLGDDGLSIVPREINGDETAFFGFELSNDGDDLISLRAIRLVAVDDTCQDLDWSQRTPQTWWSDGELLRLQADDSFVADNEILAAQDLSTGSWCVRLEVTDRSGARQLIGDAVDVEILPPFGQDSPVDVEVIAEFDDANSGGPDDDGPDAPASGCACNSANGPTGPSLWLVFMGLLALFIGRRGRRARPSGPDAIP